MLINSVNSNIKFVQKKLEKPVTQYKLATLASDAFQKNTDVSNPIKTYASTNVAFRGLFDFVGEKSKKIDAIENNARQKYGKRIVSLDFGPDKFSPKDTYSLQIELDNDEKHAEFYDKQLNKIAEEDVKVSLSKDTKKLYTIKKSVDYRNNTTTKSREEYENGRLSLTNEVKIVKDKNGELLRKEMMTLSPVSGAYNQKYVYPDGTEKVISDVHKYKKFDNMDCIKKDMTSLDGTRTQYRLEQDEKGNKLLEYKITDKNGKVLMNLNKTMERVGKNKVISTSGDKVYEVTMEDDRITIQEKGNKETVIPLNPKSFFSKGLKLDGDKEKMRDLLSKLPAEQLLALADTVKVLNGIEKTSDCMMKQDVKQIDTIDDVFSVLHETGHAVDYKKSNIILNNWKSISTDGKLRKIYTEEKEAFNKAYPNAQREYIEYFTNQESHYTGKKWGGLEEVVAEVNALRDSYTTEDYLAPRVQYLQQFYPRTIAYINDKLENYKG